MLKSSASMNKSEAGKFVLYKIKSGLLLTVCFLNTQTKKCNIILYNSVEVLFLPIGVNALHTLLIMKDNVLTQSYQLAFN